MSNYKKYVCESKNKRVLFHILLMSCSPRFGIQRSPMTSHCLCLREERTVTCLILRIVNFLFYLKVSYNFLYNIQPNFFTQPKFFLTQLKFFHSQPKIFSLTTKIFPLTTKIFSLSIKIFSLTIEIFSLTTKFSLTFCNKFCKRNEIFN